MYNKTPCISAFRGPLRRNPFRKVRSIISIYFFVAWMRWKKPTESWNASDALKGFHWGICHTFFSRGVITFLATGFWAHLVYEFQIEVVSSKLEVMTEKYDRLQQLLIAMASYFGLQKEDGWNRNNATMEFLSSTWYPKANEF